MKTSLRVVSLWMIVVLASSACGGPLDSLYHQATPTPRRFQTREVVYSAAAGDHLLRVTLDELTLLKSSSQPDTQVLAVLASGQSPPSYVLYPSNQPGIPETSVQLSGYPLQIMTPDSQASLWVLALRHQAFPVVERIGMSPLANLLAERFDALLKGGDPKQTSLPLVVGGDEPALLTWFGEIDVLGELVVSLKADENWSVGAQQVDSPDEGFDLAYHVESDVSASVIAPPGETDSTQRPGYRLVLDESFGDGQSATSWFSRKADTYSVDVVNGAYQIKLTSEDPDLLSWGSMQDVVLGDYIVRARMRILERFVLARYGLWLRYQDDYNFLFFGIENTGNYRIARFQHGYKEIVPWGKDSIINKGNESNVLEVQVHEDTYTMSINGKTLVTVSDQTFEQGRLAFFCYAENPPVTCRLEQLQIWVPESAPVPDGVPAP